LSLFPLVSILISLAAVSSYVNCRHIKLPTTVGVMLVALVASLALVLVGPYAGGFREQVAGLFVGNQGRAFAMTEKTREHVDTFWELIDEILNVVLFLPIGLELLVLPIERRWLGGRSPRDTDRVVGALA
jgi:Na+:H+ antiporter